MPRAAPWQLDTPPCSLHLLSTKQSLKTSSRFVGLFKALKKNKPYVLMCRHRVPLPSQTKSRVNNYLNITKIQKIWAWILITYPTFQRRLAVRSKLRTWWLVMAGTYSRLSEGGRHRWRPLPRVQRQEPTWGCGGCLGICRVATSIPY